MSHFAVSGLKWGPSAQIGAGGDGEDPDKPPRKLAKFVSEAASPTPSELSLTSLCEWHLELILDKTSIAALSILAQTNKFFAQQVRRHLETRAELIAKGVDPIIRLLVQQGFLGEFRSIRSGADLLLSADGHKKDQAVFENLSRVFNPGLSLYIPEDDELVRSFFEINSEREITKKYLMTILDIFSELWINPEQPEWDLHEEQNPEPFNRFFERYRLFLDFDRSLVSEQEGLIYLLKFLDEWICHMVEEAYLPRYNQVMPALMQEIKKRVLSLASKGELDENSIETIVGSCFKGAIVFEDDGQFARRARISSVYEDVTSPLFQSFFSKIFPLFSQAAIPAHLRCRFWINLFDIFHHGMPGQALNFPENLEIIFLKKALQAAGAIPDPEDQVKALLHVQQCAFMAFNAEISQQATSRLLQTLKAHQGAEVWQCIQHFDNRLCMQVLMSAKDEDPIFLSALLAHILMSHQSDQDALNRQRLCESPEVISMLTAMSHTPDCLVHFCTRHDTVVAMMLKSEAFVPVLQALFVEADDKEMAIRILMDLIDDHQLTVSAPVFSLILMALAEKLPEEQGFFYFNKILKLNVI